MKETRPMSSPAFRVAAIAVLTAITTVMTRVVQIPTVPGQYIHFGDTAIVFTAILFGPFTGAIAAGAGTAFADLLSGPFAYWWPASLVVHGVQGLVIGLIAAVRPGNRFVAAVAGLVGAAAMVGGYYVAAGVFFGQGFSLWGSLWNAVQGVAGVVLGLLAAVAVDRAYPPVRQWKW